MQNYHALAKILNYFPKEQSILYSTSSHLDYEVTNWLHIIMTILKTQENKYMPYQLYFGRFLQDYQRVLTS